MAETTMSERLKAQPTIYFTGLGGGSCQFRCFEGGLGSLRKSRRDNNDIRFFLHFFSCKTTVNVKYSENTKGVWVFFFSIL